MNIHSKESSTTITTLPTAPASAVRLRLFQPSRRPRHLTTDWLTTPWGRCRVRGCIGQTHADVLDACMHVAIKHTVGKEGHLHLLIDPFTLRSVLGTSRQYSHEWLFKLLEDLCAVTIRWEANISTKNSKFVSRGIGGIIDSVSEAKATKFDPRTGADRHLLGVTLSPVWSKLIADDIGLFYDPQLLCGMGGTTQAVARMILSHSVGKNGIGAETVFGWLGIAGAAKRKARMRLNADTKKLKKAGILVENGMLKRVLK